MGLQSRPQGMDVDQVSRLIHDLATARSKVERLDAERSSLQDKVSALRTEMTAATESQKRALVEAEAAAATALEEEQVCFVVFCSLLSPHPIHSAPSLAVSLDYLTRPSRSLVTSSR